MMKAPETDPEEAAAVLSLRHRPSEAVSLNIPLDTLEDIRQVAHDRLREVQRDPYHGTGQPERLRHDLAGCWSRRIH